MTVDGTGGGQGKTCSRESLPPSKKSTRTRPSRGAFLFAPCVEKIVSNHAVIQGVGPLRRRARRIRAERLRRGPRSCGLLDKEPVHEVLNLLMSGGRNVSACRSSEDRISYACDERFASVLQRGPDGLIVASVDPVSLARGVSRGLQGTVRCDCSMRAATAPWARSNCGGALGEWRCRVGRETSPPGGAREVPDVSVQDTWGRLRADKNAVLIDVRTRAEWSFVGLPDLAEIGKPVLTVEWLTFPESRPNFGFMDRLSEQLDELGATKDTELFFICRSGARSRAAAEAMAEKGYTRCHNVADGFEGPLDGQHRRGRVAGWKAANLPWVQG